jgi:chromosome partitioning protein
VSILDHRADLGADYVLLADELLGRLKLTAARRRIQPMVEAAAANGRPAAPDQG